MSRFEGVRYVHHRCRSSRATTRTGPHTTMLVVGENVLTAVASSDRLLSFRALTRCFAERRGGPGRKHGGWRVCGEVHVGSLHAQFHSAKSVHDLDRRGIRMNCGLAIRAVIGAISDPAYDIRLSRYFLTVVPPGQGWSRVFSSGRPTSASTRLVLDYNLGHFTLALPILSATRQAPPVALRRRIASHLGLSSAFVDLTSWCTS